MENKAYICKRCAVLKRYQAGSNPLHCDLEMQVLSDEQAFVATHLNQGNRLSWLAKGAHVLKGPSKRKKWMPATTDSEIEESIVQKATHKPKKPLPYDVKVQADEVFNSFAAPYKRINTELYEFLQKRNAMAYFEEILFISIPAYREDVYSYIRKYDMKHLPRNLLEHLFARMFGIVKYSDERIEKELIELWSEKGFEERKPSPFFGDGVQSVFRLRNHAVYSGIHIQQVADLESRRIRGRKSVGSQD